MCAVRGAERVIDVNIRHGSQLFGKGRVVCLFLFVEADVLKQHDLTGLERRGFCLGIGADNVFCHDHGLTQQLGELGGNRSERQLGHIALCFFQRGGGSCCLFCLRQSGDLFLFFLIEFQFLVENVVGSAEVRAKNHCGTVFHQVLDGGQSADNPLGIGDHTVFHRNIEIATGNYFFAFDVNVFNGFLVVGHNINPFHEFVTSAGGVPPAFPNRFIVTHTRALIKRF